MNVVTQKLPLKKLHVLRSQCPPSGFLPPEYLRTVLGNTCRCRSHAAPLVQCLEVYGEIIISWADAAPVECAGDHALVLAVKYCLSFRLYGVAKKAPDLQVRVWKKSKWYRHCSLLRTADLFFISAKQYFLCNSSGCTAMSWVVQTVSCWLKLAWQRDGRGDAFGSLLVQ